MKTAVTILIPSYNAGHYLAEALASVIAQTYPYWQAIVIDDASTDHSIEQASHFFTDSRITLLRNPRNIGQSKALNKGLALVQTRYTVQLDSDDWFAPETLAVLVAAADTLSEKIALVSGNLTLVVENADGNIIKEEVWRNRSFKDRYDFLLANCSQWPRFYRTSALKSIGGWPTDDPYGGRYMEDKRVLLRLIEDYHFHWIDQVLYFHRRHSRNQTKLTHIYNEMLEWVVRETLLRWGNSYEPVFKADSFSRKHLVNLLPKK